MVRHFNFSGVDLAEWFDASPNPYVILDTDRRIVACNRAYLSVTGRTRDEIVGRRLSEAFPAPPGSISETLLANSIERVLADKVIDEIALIPYSVSRPGEPETMRYWSATHTPLFDPQGQLAYILQHTVDVTEIEALRQARQGAQISAEQGVLKRASAVQSANTLLAGEMRSLRSIFEMAPSFIAVLTGPAHRVELANPAYHALTGRAPGTLVGRDLAEALPEIVPQGFLALLEDVYASGKPHVGKGVAVTFEPADGKGPALRHVDFVLQPVAGPDGAVSGVFVQGHDITEQKRSEHELARQGEILRLAQEAGGFGTFEWDLESGLVRGSPTFMTFYGLVGETHPVGVFSERVHPADRTKLATSATAGTLAERIGRTEYRVVKPDGDVRWIARQGAVHFDETGAPVRVLGAAYDVTERKALEEHLGVIAGESAHRVKNTLAMVQAVVNQTLRRATSLEDAGQAISERLGVLAQTQDVLTRTSGVSAAIGDVVVSALALHSDTFGRIVHRGPALEVDVKTGLGLGLMLHELGTNAVKYGALSTPEGTVVVEWWESEHEGAPAIGLRWAEAGGPPVVKPERRGFGSNLIERGLSHRPGNLVRLDYDASGLVCTARILID